MKNSADIPARPVVARFCPSPTGTPHVGMARTALFNWAFARHHGGTLVFRIEDTDHERNTEASYNSLIDSMQWLGLDWDEGPLVGGPHGPYKQSERGEIYSDVVARLHAAGHLYESYSTSEEVTARHVAAGRDPKLGYDNYDRDPSQAFVAAAKAEGRPAVMRLRMPASDNTFTDLVRGSITFPAGSVPDPVMVRGNSDPLYTLVNPVDDALMGITHVLRGEDLLPSTPRQIALYKAMADIGVGNGIPEFGHMPFVTGAGNRKLSKRDPESSLFHHRDAGFIREGMVNYLALLGFSIGEHTDVFSPQELVAAFDIHRVSSNPARFDVKKAEAINGSHIRLLQPADFAARLVPYLQAAGLLPAEPEELSAAERALVAAAAPLVQERSNLMVDAVTMLAFLFVKESDFAIDAAAGAKTLTAQAVPVLERSLEVLTAMPEFTSAQIESELKRALIEELGLKPRVAFAALRVAATGNTVSPPLYESLELLGREISVKRLSAALEIARTATESSA
ncbi:glutamate--tRNA ligase [Nakamurella antarctica]|uniref:Glutamate--tRNA ligase n=1 Tax=Nakamurella antarctica TaxID=1902245 RepID=A0A3G8ZVH4_9ACTN|nr:glutamate--tRNA ligase [Nakamurella antarctica]AZI58474.1 glutamate--tRNA ligase [Nakamurella antarctica]